MSVIEAASLQIVHYPHPALRRRSHPVRRLDAELRAVVRRMYELMYASRGIGLAANQVGLPLRLFVVNLAASPEEGQEWTLINPVLDRPRGSETAEEGCLSFPELYGRVRRPKKIRVLAYDVSGAEVRLDLEGLAARAVQHEYDHLDGVLFTDRMEEEDRLKLAPRLAELERRFAELRERGEAPSDAEIAEAMDAWARRFG